MNKYLEKIATFEKAALRRAVAEFAKGNISKSLEQLYSKGVIKSPKVYAEGMRRGNDVLAKHTNSIITKARPGTILSSVADNGGGYSNVGKKGGGSHIIISRTPNSSLVQDSYKSILHQGNIRHELFESMDLNHFRKDPLRKINIDRKKQYKDLAEYGVDNKVLDKVKKLHNNVDEYKGTFLKHPQHGIIGNHQSPRVLTRESEMVRKNPYLNDSILRGLRDDTGESHLIKRITGKRYGMDKMTSKDHAKALTVKADSVEDIMGNGVRFNVINTIK